MSLRCPDRTVQQTVNSNEKQSDPERENRIINIVLHLDFRLGIQWKQLTVSDILLNTKDQVSE